MITKSEILEALKNVMDPEVHVSIVTMNMVRNVDISPNGHIAITVALTVPSCPLASTIQKDIQDIILALEDVRSVEVTLSSMSDEEKERMWENLQAKRGKGQPQLQRPGAWLARLPKKEITHIVAVISGKGGVGKSLVTALMATELKRQGFKVGILDADLTGPSMAKIFGLKGIGGVGADGVRPASSGLGVEVMSMNLLLKNPQEAVIWRGPIITNALRQLYMDVKWGALDFLLLDLPPGTSDVPLTIYQVFPIDGVVIVSSPQDLAGMIVMKAINMAKVMKIPLLGLVENMSYAVCPHCSERLEVFGPSKGEALAKAAGIPYLGALPLDPEISALCDEGKIEEYKSPVFAEMAKKVISTIPQAPRIITQQ